MATVVEGVKREEKMRDSETTRKIHSLCEEIKKASDVKLLTPEESEKFDKREIRFLNKLISDAQSKLTVRVD
jgi:hypothetical protein